MTTDTHLVFEGPDTLIWWKESGIPTVPLKNTIDGRTLLSIASAYYPEIRCCHGDNPWEGGVVHRLDNLTKGLVLIARNQKAYDALMQQQKKDMIVKEYRAKTSSGRSLEEGFEPFPQRKKKEILVRSIMGGKAGINRFPPPNQIRQAPRPGRYTGQSACF